MSAGDPMSVNGYEAYEAYEAIEARRLAEALDALEAGADPGIDPREDPELSAQIETVRAVRELHLEATRQPSFATYVRRSGAFIQQQLRQERAPQPVPRPVTAVAEPVKAGRVHFLFRWSTLAPVTSAAAAAAIVLAFVVLNSSSPASSPPTQVTQPQLPVPEAPLTEETSPLRVPAPDPGMLERMAQAESLIGEQRALVSRSAEDELRRIRTILDEIAATNARGELVADALLLEFTRGSADLALLIRTTPESIRPRDGHRLHRDRGRGPDGARPGRGGRGKRRHAPHRPAHHAGRRGCGGAVPVRQPARPRPLAGC